MMNNVTISLEKGKHRLAKQRQKAPNQGEGDTCGEGQALAAACEHRGRYEWQSKYIEATDRAQVEVKNVPAIF